jgi:hypothetical protein
MKKSRGIILSLVCSSFTAAPALADQQAVFDIESVKTVHTQARPEKGKEPPPVVDKVVNEKNTMTVSMGADYVISETPEGKTIYNFGEKQVYQLTPAKKEYGESDLHSVAMFRVNEYQNRKMMAEMIKKAGAAMPLSSDFELQSLFGLAMPGEKLAEIQAVREGKTTKYMQGKDEIATTIDSDYELDPASKTAFRRFLVQYTKLHPTVREKILAEKKMPAEMKWNFADKPLQEGTVTFKLKELKTIPAQATAPPAEFRRIVPGELTQIYESLDKLGPTPKQPTLASATEAADKAVKAGNPLDALLIMTDYTLSTGENIDEYMKKLAPSLRADVATQKFMLNITPQSKEQAEAAIKELKAIDRTKLTKGHVIDVMLGNIYQNIDPIEAEKYMKLALAANPLLGGAYHDLGEIYILQYQTPTAWDTFRLGKRVSPTHPMLADVDQMNKKLESTFPDFF